MTFDSSSSLLSWEVHWFRLSGSGATAAHFHGPADPGVAAGVQITIPGVSGVSGSTSGSATLTPTQVGYLNDRKLYINIHTILNVPGEVRGQVGLAGSSEISPVFPTSIVYDLGSSNVLAWLFTNAPGSGALFDPTPANAFVFETTDGASRFTSVTLPGLLMVPDANGTYVISDAVNGSAVVAAGAQHNFATAVEKFTISDIFAEVDGDNPTAFPVFLEFDQVTASFSMSPLNLPRLTAELAGDELRLSWPVSATGFELYRTTSLTSPDWQHVTELPAVEGDFNVVILPTTEDPTAYFRLQKP
jgi:hypothetical protein